jgi:hypothetical protein
VGEQAGINETEATINPMARKEPDNRIIFRCILISLPLKSIFISRKISCHPLIYHYNPET